MKPIMKKYLSIIAVLLAACAIAVAESVFAEFIKSDYEITESTSLGGSVSMSHDVVLHQNTGDVSGSVQFNTKTRTIKFSSRKIKYEEGAIVTKVINHACISSGKGYLVGDGGEVSFQLIEDMRDNSINMIVKWPDYSSVRFLAVLKSRASL